MRKSVFFCSLILLFTAHTATAGEIRELDLTDGSTITGEVLSLSNGVYTVKSESLGTIRVEASKIRSMHTPESGSAAGSKKGGAGTGTDVKALQEKMLTDGEIMSLIQSLQSDPAFQKMLEDPEIMKAVNSGDVAALMARPDFMNLLNNATVQEIQKKVK